MPPAVPPTLIVFAEDARQMEVVLSLTPELEALGLGPSYMFFAESEFDTFDRYYDARRALPQLKSALASFREALRRVPGDPGITFSVGYALCCLRAFDRALSVFRKLWPLCPHLRSLLAVWIGNALVMRSFGGGVQAAEWFNRAIEAEPLWPYAHYRAAIGCRESGDLTAATSRAERSIELNPSYPYGYYELGNILLKRGDYLPAIASFQRALGLAPRLAGARYQLGRALLLSGRLAAARAEFSRMTQEFPRNPFGYVGLANVAALERKRAAAVRWLRRALALDPDNPQASANLGSILLVNGRFDEAEPALRRALCQAPEDPWVGYHLAIALAHRGKVGEAKAILGNVIRHCESYPDMAPVAESARRLLEALDSG